MTLTEWIINGEVGVSSKTMWAAITGAVTGGDKGGDYDVPRDDNDFRRCYEFVEACEIVSEELDRVKRVFPWYAPFIDAWDELVAMWTGLKSLPPETSFNQVIDDLELQSKRIAGYEQVSDSIWVLRNKDGQPTSISINVIIKNA